MEKLNYEAIDKPVCVTAKLELEGNEVKKERMSNFESILLLMKQ